MDLQGLAAAAALMSTDAVAAGGASSAAAASETAGPAGQRRSTRRRNLVTTAATSAAAGGAAASAAAVSSPAGRKRAAAPALTEGATDDKALSTTISSSNSYSTGGNNAGKGREKGSKSKGEESSSSMTASAVDSSIVNSSGSSCKRRRVAASTEQSQGQQSQQRQDAEHSNGDGTMIADAAGPGVMGEQVAAGDDDNQNRGILNNEDLAASAALQSFTSDSRNTSITSPTQPTTPLSADGVAGLGAEEGQASKDGAAATVAGSSSVMEGRGSSDSENRGIFEAHPQVLPLLPPELTRAASAAVSPVVADPGVSKSGLAASSSSRGSAGGAGHLSAASVQQNGATSTQNSAGISAGAISFMPGITNQPTSASYAAPSAASAPSQSAYSHYQPAADLPHQQEQQQPAWSPSDLLSSYKLPPIPVPHSGDTAVPSSSSLSAGSAFPPGPSTYHHEPLPYGDLHYPIEDSLAGLDQQSSHQLPPPPLQYSHQSGIAPEQQEQQQQQSHEQLYQQNFADGSVASEAAAPLVPAKKQKGRRPNLQTGEAKNHRCSFEGCEWAFSRREHLKRHEKTHTQDRPFTCDVPMCDLRFSRLDNLNSHKRTHEKGKRTSQWHGAKVVGSGDVEAGARSQSAMQSAAADSQTPGSSTGQQSPLYIPPYGHDSYESVMDTQTPYGGYELAGLYETSPLPPLPPATSSTAPAEQENYTNGIPVPQTGSNGTSTPYLPPLPQPAQIGKRKRGTGVQK